ncbi:MAG: mevalonate kinase [Thaumarchaeota archaeon]|nr:mevalonate kinase [Nitrososphaerota archaeon]MCL5068451.1 mevalonate kinase [Nitrososphaerota archaeon]
MNSDLRSASASAPGKVIVAGEHFVVHGAYAVAAAINRRVKVTVSSTARPSHIVSGLRTSMLGKNDGRFSAVKSVAKRTIQEFGKPRGPLKIEIASDIPAGSGLGSSAAVSVATAAALVRFLGNDVEKSKIGELAMTGERQVHGNPSGIDIESSLNGGLLLFSRLTGTRHIPIEKALQLIVVFSGKKRKTADLISRVTEKRQEYPAFFENLSNAVSFLSLDIVEAISAGDLPKLGALMNVAQTSLSWIGVSNETLDNIIEVSSSGGAYGAKVTGAGGGGSVIVLPRAGSAEPLLKEISKKFFDSFITTIPQEGLRWETVGI